MGPKRPNDGYLYPSLPSYIKNHKGVRVVKPAKGYGHFIFMHGQWFPPGVLPPAQPGGQVTVLGMKDKSMDKAAKKAVRNFKV